MQEKQNPAAEASAGGATDDGDRAIEGQITSPRRGRPDLPPALAPLAALDHWVCWRLEKRKGKPTKPPYQVNGENAEADNAATWATYDAASRATGFTGIGFCLLNTDFAAFDIDRCRDPKTGAIEPWAQAVVEKANSYAEITPSGSGLRIIGIGTGEKVHRKLKVPEANGVSCEIYRKATRFITVTGNVHRDAHLANIDAVIDAVLAELDTKKKKSAKPKSEGGTHDLTPALVTMLCTTGCGGYPSRSELLFAFLIGAIRAEVAAEAIIAACTDDRYADGGIYQHVQDNGGQHYVERQIAKARDASVNSEVAKLNETYALVIIGDKTAVMNILPDGGIKFLTLSAFEQWFANQFVIHKDKNGDDKRTPLAKAWLHHPQRRQYEGIVFAPKRDVPNHFNLWRGFAVEPRQGDCSKFLAHLKDNVCRGDDDLYLWVVGWFADIFQNPEKKSGTSLALRGKQGVGKTKVGEVIGSLLGSHYALVSDPRYVTGRFNSHLVSCLLLHCDEAFWAGDRAAEGTLKDLVSGTAHFIEFKGKEPIRVLNFVRLFPTGNPDWLVPAGLEERRFAVLDVGEDHIQDGPYFAAIDAEMDSGGREALLYHLLNFDLSKVNLREIPKTAALLDQKISSGSTEQSWWFDTLMRGELPWGVDDPNGCPAQRLFDRYIRHARRAGARRRSIETQIGMFLAKVVPGLIKKKGDYQLPLAKSHYGPIYTFPALAECRAGFAVRLQQTVEWPKDEGGWTKEPGQLPDLEDPF
jgi:hypothetical protein